MSAILGITAVQKKMTTNYVQYGAASDKNTAAHEKAGRRQAGQFTAEV